jgi:hypothetical protein
LLCNVSEISFSSDFCENIPPQRHYCGNLVGINYHNSTRAPWSPSTSPHLLLTLSPPSSSAPCGFPSKLLGLPLSCKKIPYASFDASPSAWKDASPGRVCIISRKAAASPSPTSCSGAQPGFDKGEGARHRVENNLLRNFEIQNMKKSQLVNYRIVSLFNLLAVASDVDD